MPSCVKMWSGASASRTKRGWFSPLAGRKNDSGSKITEEIYSAESDLHYPNGSTDINTIVGPVNWKGGPVGNVAKTPVLGGQWVKGQKFKYELAIVDNSTAKIVPAAAQLQLL